MRMRIGIQLLMLLSLLVGSPLIRLPSPVQASSSAQAASQNACEVRGAWFNHYAFKTDETRAESFSKIEAANLNTLFVLAPAIGDNNGWSSAPNFYKFLNEALARDLSVHIWVANRFRDGRVDFTDRAEQIAQKEWVIQLLEEYPEVDGVHFDYIRYDKYEVATETGPYAHLPQVDTEKTEAINTIVRESFEEMKALYPDKHLTAAVRGIADNGVLSGGPYGDPVFWDRNLPFHREAQQAPVQWINDGYLDGAMSMTYTTNDAHWMMDIDEWKARTGSNFDKVFMGLGWISEDFYPDWGFDAAGVVRKINYGRSIGAKGFVIFELGSAASPGNGQIDWELIDALSVDSELNNFAAPFKEPVPSCLATSQDGNLPGDELDEAHLIVEAFQDVTFAKTSTSAQENNIIDVKVEVHNVSDLYGLQVECEVDPAVLLWQSAEFGHLFNEPLVGANTIDAEAAKWQGAISQKNPAPALSGDGTFAMLTFEVVAPGTSSITCDALASDRNGFEIPIITIAETVEIIDDPIESLGGILGNVGYQGRADHSGIEVNVIGSTQKNIQTDNGGQFELVELESGDYDVRVDANLYLSNCTVATIYNGEETGLMPTLLAGGDTNDDEIIKINDATLLGSNFGLSNATVPAMDPRADINADGEVNIQDLSIMGGNFGKQGCQGWPTDT